MNPGFKYLFGPVPSRRLGMSLGVDLVPKKVCSLNCVYCEVGPTTKLTKDRMEYIPHKKIISELGNYFATSPPPDYITFSGFGEPTLNSAIGKIIQFIKKNRPEIPVAVLTNGTLLSKAEVRKDLRQADLILPSLDAATQQVFEKINAPAKGLNIDEYIQGIANFSKDFSGKIWLEIFILPDYNDHESELTKLKKAILKINPDRIQLNTLDRPGRVENLQPATIEKLNHIIEFWQLEHVEIIAKTTERKNLTAYRKDLESAILGTISRRPCTAADLSQFLGTHVNEINKYLEILESDDKIIRVWGERGAFYRAL